MKGVILAVAGTLAIGMSSPAGALDVLSTTGTGPVGNCQPARPVYESLLRKRPLSYENEGDRAAFVTCAMTTEEVSLNVQSFSTRVSNLSTAPQTVSCTAVIGDELDGADYIHRSVTLAPGSAGNITWSAAEAGGLFTSKSIAISCLLPPMTGLNRNRVTTLLSLI